MLINNDWDSILNNEYSKEYFQELISFIKSEYTNKTIFPPQNDIFAALNLTLYKDVKVVILGQDPYHGEGEAHGLAFSVKEGIKLPPSLINIFKELDRDLHIKRTKGTLDDWAKQGVLLLNTVLTVEKDKPNSHKRRGWENFTNVIIKKLNERDDSIVFILWGNHAKEKEKLITNNQHLVLESSHPSPFSCRQGFEGSKPFSKTNAFLVKNHKKPIKW
ncbi:MAG: uracil-DNA glycosylase [Bacilli bacterium]|nr:uracil-DNA glycosylase [Bacilli bacterium]MDD3305172.1 uracil-DNA glycosylase [Bacilli bacterium]MDD4053997.1 uracil-DNA glycosylase [Bacilli bacterium]MDD4411722.1 uracil-DNA glycosylase [Bacilli bacterium]